MPCHAVVCQVCTLFIVVFVHARSNRLLLYRYVHRVEVSSIPPISCTPPYLMDVCTDLLSFTTSQTDGLLIPGTAKRCKSRSGGPPNPMIGKGKPPYTQRPYGWAFLSLFFSQGLCFFPCPGPNTQRGSWFGKGVLD